jgi:hypothetical protein
MSRKPKWSKSRRAPGPSGVSLTSPVGQGFLHAGLAEFLARRFWHAHEQWEKVWRALDGDEKHWVQGLILLAAAAWHLERQREPVTRRLLTLAAERLHGCPGLPGLALPAGLAARAGEAARAPSLSLPPVPLALSANDETVRAEPSP